VEPCLARPFAFIYQRIVALGTSEFAQVLLSSSAVPGGIFTKVSPSD
jgi:hypothetical protein